VKQALKQLLDTLDDVSRAHTEVSDTAVREAMADAIHQRFVLQKKRYRVPTEFGMFSPAGNHLVRDAIAAFLAHVDAVAASKSLTSDERLAAFQDASVVSSLGYHYDDYFGHADRVDSTEARKALARKLVPPKDHIPPYPGKKNYQAGDWFAVPLRTKGFGIGLVARTKRGRCLGYFFGPLRLSTPSLNDCIALMAKDAQFVKRFGDYHIRIGCWTKLGMLPGWNKDEWPMPVFASTVWGNTAHYPDEDPSADPRLARATDEELQSLPKDSLAGSGAVEIALTIALDSLEYEAMRR